MKAGVYLTAYNDYVYQLIDFKSLNRLELSLNSGSTRLVLDYSGKFSQIGVNGSVGSSDS